MSDLGQRASRREYLLVGLLLLAAAWIFGWGIGSYPLWDPWEPKYAQAVREMRERGDFITPYLDGRIRWTKPILIYWAIWGAEALFGENEFAIRLPSVLAGVFGVWAVYYTLRRLRGFAAGIAGGAILATLPQYFYLARQAMPDMLLTAFLAGAMGFLALARFQQDERRVRHLAGFWACLAVAFLAKGPLACVITAWALAIFLLADLDRSWFRPSEAWSRMRALAASYRLGLGLVIFCVVALPWYAAILIRHGGAFIENFILDENIQRFSEPLFGHEGVSSRYVTTLLHGTFPWVGLLLAGLLFQWKRDAVDEGSRQHWFFFSWILATFTIITLAGTKLDHYLLPAMPAVAVMVALACEAWRTREHAWVGPMLVLSAMVTFLSFHDFVFVGNRHIMNVFAPAQDVLVTSDSIDLVLWVVVVVWLAAAGIAWVWRGSRVAAALALAAALGHAAYFSHVALPAHAAERSLKVYSDVFAEVAEPDAELVFHGWIRYSLHYYHGDDYRYFTPNELEGLTEFVKGKPHVYIVAQNLFFDEMLDALHRATRSRWTTISEAHPTFTLISNRVAGPAGDPSDAPVAPRP